MNRNIETEVNTLIERHVEGYSLEQKFYCDPDIFSIDVERAISPLWQLVDHVSRIPNPGDYFLCEIARESVIVARGKDREIHAFFNVCRHRGSRVCTKKAGNTTMLVCPYHAWTYNLDGSLKSAPLMHEDFDKRRHGLHTCHIRIFEGLIFLCMSRAGEAPDFEDFIGPLRPLLEIHDLGSAKIVHRGDYATEGNWKLVVENFFECYHCLSAHPEYCAVHPKEFVLAIADDYAAYQTQLDAFNVRGRALGHPTGIVEGDQYSLHFARGRRYPIREGFLTETEDGRPAAPLMGKLKEWDGGTTGAMFSPFATLLAMNDFVTIFRFIPRDELYTDVELIWLVRDDAEEGKDYDVKRMTWMWDRTVLQDKWIIENNQAGILSRAYRPGPYSRAEKNANRFVQWYLHRLREEGKG